MKLIFNVSQTNLLRNKLNLEIYQILTVRNHLSELYLVFNSSEWQKPVGVLKTIVIVSLDLPVS